MTLGQLQTACENSENLKQYWDSMSRAAGDLVIALTRRIDDKVRCGQAREETETAISAAQTTFEQSRNALFIALGREKIKRPKSLDAFAVFRLFV